MALRIEDYRFGRIVVGGTAYTEDVVILRGAVRCPWHRTAGGHLFAPEDLAEVVAARPEIVLLGRGYFGLAKVTAAAVDALQTAGAQVVAGRTATMVREFNRLAAAGHDVAACLHLTC